MISLRSSRAGDFLRTAFASLFICVLISLTPPSAPAQELYDFNSLASKAAQAIEKASHGSAHTIVLITNFSVDGAPDSQLSDALTRDFAEALRRQDRNFTVVDRADIERAIAGHELPEGALNSPRITACYAPELNATVIVSASFEYTPGKLVFDLSVSTVQGDRGIFDDKIIIDRTPPMEELMIKPVPEMVGSYGEDKTVWVRDEESRTKPLPPSSGVQGYSFPSCVRCGPARYSDAAVKAKVQGTVLLDVVIGADGRAEKISVKRALPCGLDQQAINAVKDWEFKPATGPDGKPAAVLQTAEVTFHLY
jgi:TonB family protein